MPNNSKITQTVCTPETLVFEGAKGSFTASDGTTYRLTRGTGGAVQVEVVKR